MANDNEIPLELTLDTKDADKGLKDFQKNAGKAADSVEKSFDALKTVAVAAVAVFAGSKLISGLKNIVDQASEADQAVRSLGTAMALTGEFSDQAVSSFTELASEIQKTTIFSDEAVLSAATLAKSFGLSNEQAKNLTKTAVDLAAATGKDLNSAVQELGGTYSGTAGRLAKLVPELKKLSEEQLRAGAANDIVRKKFEGFALESAKTFEGVSKITGNAFGEIFESLGKVITQNPIVVAVIKELGKAFFGIAEFIDKNKEGLNNFVSAGLKTVVSFIPDVINAFKTFIAIIRTTIEIFADLVVALLTVGQTVFNILKPFRDFANILGNVVAAGISNFVSNMVKIARVIPGVSSAFKNLGIDLDEIQKTVDGFRDNRINDALALDTSVSDSYSQFINETTDGIKDLVKSAQKTSDEFLETVTTGTTQVGQYADKAVDKILGVNDASLKVTAGLKGLNKEQQKLIDNSAELDRIKGSYDKIKGAIEGLQQEIDKQTLSAKQLIDVEEKRSLLLLKNAQREIEIDSKLSKSQKQLANEQLELFEKLVKKKAELANEKIILTLQTDVAAGFGKAFDAALSGKSGAVSLFQNAAGAFASQFGEQFGPIVSSIIGKLAAGPEQAKAFVKEFFDAIPDIIIAIVEALPEAIATIIEKAFSAEFIIRLSVAMGKAFIAVVTAGLSSSSIGKKWGIEFSNYVKASFNGGAQAAYTSIVTAFTQGAVNLYNSIITAFQQAIAGLSSAITSAFQAVYQGLISVFTGGASSLFQGILSAFQEGGAAVFRSITEAGTNLANAFTGPVDRLIDFLNNFSFPEVGGGILGGGGGVAGKIAKSVIGGAVAGPVGAVAGISGRFAMGGIVPPGFPNDSFGASLSSNEMVLPPNITSGLINLIESGGNSGGEQDNSLIAAQLAQVVQLLSNPVTATATATVSGKAFADIMLELSRNNARISA